MEILFDCGDYIVCKKPAGFLSEAHETKRNVPAELEALTGSEVYCAHRLDRDVSGVMVYAKTRDFAAELSRQIAGGTFKKTYSAVCKGSLEEPSGRMTDYLFKDSRRGKVFAVKSLRRGVKEAILDYRVEKEKDGMSLVQVNLVTGRTHQIRVQFASRSHPLIGDAKYGGREKCGIALFCRKISFTSPNGETVSYSSEPPDVFPWSVFAEQIENGES